ncbi:amidohydrolase family protein [uncultured Brevibacterium sp.]|uniref:amidohydrolase family protein n=1 Tax=uncultured Brevibacterium sp. TaxID=189678 RepID=UPI0025F4FD71|nr:amidohydrolase family protein [uncultured Brevibacterium sp.]
MARALGPERTQLCYRVRSLIDAGIRVPGSSDAPMVDGSPILGIHDFVNRRTAGGAEFGPAETITAEQALRAYTVDSAFASHEDTLKGDLSIGKLADFTVLSDDLLQVPAEELKDVQVGATVVGGEIRYDDGAIRS